MELKLNEIVDLHLNNPCDICFDLECHNELKCGNPKCDKRYCFNCYNKLKSNIRYRTYDDKQLSIELICPYCRVDSQIGVFDFKDKDLIIQNAKIDYIKYQKELYNCKKNYEMQLNLKTNDEIIKIIKDLTHDNKIMKYINFIETENVNNIKKYDDMHDKFLEIEKRYTEIKLINDKLKIDIENKANLLRIQHKLINNINDNIINVFTKNNKNKTIRKKDLYNALTHLNPIINIEL